MISLGLAERYKEFMKLGSISRGNITIGEMNSRDTLEYRMDNVAPRDSPVFVLDILIDRKQSRRNSRTLFMEGLHSFDLAVTTSSSLLSSRVRWEEFRSLAGNLQVDTHVGLLVA